MPKKKRKKSQKKYCAIKKTQNAFPTDFGIGIFWAIFKVKKNCPSDLWMLFHCSENRDTNSSTVVSLQGFSKEAASGVGMDFHIEIRVNYNIMYKILYIEPTNLHITLQTYINEFSFFDMCFEFMQRFRQVRCLLWAQRWLSNWLPHNLSTDEKKGALRESIKL